MSAKAHSAPKKKRARQVLDLAIQVVEKRARRKGQRKQSKRVEDSEIRGGQFNKSALNKTVAGTLNKNALGAATSINLSGYNPVAMNY
jgi:hypothetical protein